MLKNKHIILGITGGIAAYKSAELARLLKKQGARVSVVMTEGAKEFITPLTFSSLTGEAVYDDLWQNRNGTGSNIAHINLTREADAFLIAPCTANAMSKIAHGVADDLLTNLVLARDAVTCPMAIAPAMNVHMWANPATQRNLELIRQDGITIFGPASGEQACGEIGAGRLLEASDLAHAIERLFVPQSLAGKKVLITAGPTFEAIDPVRGITNRSSGKMGYALAHAAACAGANVTLISGPTALPIPFGVGRINVESAQEMLDACLKYSPESDVFIAVAAVADWRTADVATQKIKKQHTDDVPCLSFVQNPDILHTIAQQPNSPYCVGFAAETEHVIEFGQAKRLKKGIPLLIANNGPATFGADDNQVVLLDDSGLHELPKQNKAQLAHVLIAEISNRLTKKL
ncbi:Coenzyme A biosynthesis bifunctional protein CoaBC [Ephemeroptericola cinctiostellae]|uniref:Coenzyme A biosynthesis bifunctional protein CoaBC n=1 Tax=Ephemeroptericola cinctiostellae TaxID=2268024 RepID=A0A345DBR4_9BURK|nr:bifunctional phosphopantothenoylcysteine decarboxylase/phosphopantothenate--cysteine ligase CoaBC [Ephemeroptericola cinctiostellae]AXF85802.1 Coenzyme A biosynthesis bifunctional protein CoaBC [Ephemeroptericola cinctiostellae]